MTLKHGVGVEGGEGGKATLLHGHTGAGALSLGLLTFPALRDQVGVQWRKRGMMFGYVRAKFVVALLQGLALQLNPIRDFASGTSLALRVCFLLHHFVS